MPNKKEAGPQYDALEERLLLDAICRYCGQRNGEHSFHGDFCPAVGSRTKFSLFLPEEDCDG